MNQKPTKQEEIVKGITGIVVIVFFAWLLIPSCSDEKEEGENTQIHQFDKTNAIIASRDFVRDKLKSPSTAEFCNDTEKTFKYNDTAFYVISCVDSQNGFGATIRSDYSCIITYHPRTDMVNCSDLKIIQR